MTASFQQVPSNGNAFFTDVWLRVVNTSKSMGVGDLYTQVPNANKEYSDRNPFKLMCSKSGYFSINLQNLTILKDFNMPMTLTSYPVLLDGIIGICYNGTIQITDSANKVGSLCQ